MHKPCVSLCVIKRTQLCMHVFAQKLKETPGLVNESATGKGWFIRIKITKPDELKSNELLDKALEE